MRKLVFSLKLGYKDINFGGSFLICRHQNYVKYFFKNPQQN